MRTHLPRLAVFCALTMLIPANGLAGISMDFDRLHELARSRYGEQAVLKVAAWQQLLNEIANQDTLNQLKHINNFINRAVRYDDDQAIWGVSDYWASPLETLGRGRGDCEDFTIAKYVSLRLLGLSDGQLRLIYVRASLGGVGTAAVQAHMVLGYYPTPDSEPLILDNLVTEVMPASRRLDLVPVYSFNSGGLWVAGARASSADPTSRLSRWRDVLSRMQHEGLR